MSLVNSVGNIKSKQVDHEHMCLHSVTKSFPGPEHGLGSSDREDHVVNEDGNAKHYTYNKEKDGNRGFDLYIVRTKGPERERSSSYAVYGMKLIRIVVLSCSSKSYPGLGVLHRPMASVSPSFHQARELAT
jgi:hypothetical protein